MKTKNNVLSLFAGLIFMPSFLFGQGVLISSNAYVVANSGYIIITGNMANSGALNLQSGTFTMSGNYTNSGTYTQGAGDMVFNGSNQVLIDNGSGTLFTNVFFSGNGGSGNPAVMSSGKFAVSSQGVLQMVSATSLNANGNLTLNSDATGSATVAAIPSGSNISGNVNVQRYITGGSNYRGYRLISSPVYSATVSSNNVFSINYLTSSVFLTGSAGGGFDKTGNPTLYLYREDQVPSNSTFTSGNFEGISAINNSPTYNYSVSGAGTSGTFYLPVGNGEMFFFRGNRASASLTTETTPGYTPVTVTTTTTGTLNQGQVIVHDWYTPASANIGHTGSGTGGNNAVRGFNLVGNPYASSIDWSTFSGTVPTASIYGANLAPTIWTFDPGTKNFATYNATTGIATGNGGKIIAGGQGFFVQAILASPSLTFQESAKSNTQVTGSKLLMDKRTNLSALSQGAYGSYIRLKMITDSVNYSDVVVGFNPASSTNFNPIEDSRFDSGIGNLEAISAYSSDSIKTSAKWLPFPKNNANEVIRLRVYGSASGQYTISRTELNQIPAIYEIWLMDRYKKDSLDIKNNATYVFDISIGDTSSYGDNRFQLVIRQNPALGVHLLMFTAVKANKGAQIAWQTENEQNYTNFTVERSSDNGSTFQEIDGAASTGAGNYSFLDRAPPATVDLYRLKITDLNGNITYSNVVALAFGNANNTAAAGVGIQIYPNPTTGVVNLAVTQSIAAGVSVNSGNAIGLVKAPAAVVYSIKIINITGRVVKAATSSQPNWQDDVTGLPPGTYIVQVMNNGNDNLVGRGTFVKL